MIFSRGLSIPFFASDCKTGMFVPIGRRKDTSPATGFGTRQSVLEGTCMALHKAGHDGFSLLLAGA